MKRLTYILLLLMLPLLLWAQGQGVSVALRGGVTLYTGTTFKAQPAVSGGADIRYQCLWDCYHDMYIGLETGLGFGFNRAEFGGELSNQFTQQDAHGNELQYNVSAKINQISTSMQVDLPILFSAHIKGVVLNIGPSLHSGIIENFDQILKREQIDAYLPRYDITLHNEPMIGYVPESELNKRETRFAPTLRLALSAEIGYEWAIPDYYTNREHYVGLQAYAHYGVWALPTAGSEHVLYVPAMKPIDEQNPHAKASTLEIGNLCAIANRKAHPISLGIRLYYTLRGADYRAYGWHRRRL